MTGLSDLFVGHTYLWLKAMSLTSVKLSLTPKVPISPRQCSLGTFCQAMKPKTVVPFCS